MLEKVITLSKENKIIKSRFIVRPLVISKPGEQTSGDGFTYKSNAKHVKFMLGDGLGHGPAANQAVNEGAKSFKVFPDSSPVETQCSGCWLDLLFYHAANIKYKR